MQKFKFEQSSENITDNSLSSALKNIVKGKELIIIFCIMACAVSLTVSAYLFFRKSPPVGLENENMEIIAEDVQYKHQLFVDIAGAVYSPGIYELDSGSRIADAVSAAGGFTNDAYYEWLSKNINLAMKLEDSQKVYIPFIWEKSYESDITPLEDVFMKLPTGVTPDDEEPQGSLINMNTASLDELDGLPGIGPVYANKIIDSRPYQSLQDFEAKAVLPASVISKIAGSITF